MPSLLFFRRGRKEERRQTKAGNQHSNALHPSVQNNNTESNEPPRQSRRQFFRTLVKRSRSDLGSNRQGMDNTSIDFSTPPLGSMGVLAGQPSSHMSESQVRQLFSGAPQFLALSERHCIGAPHPTVMFPWDTAPNITDLCDHMKLYYAWNSITAWPNVTRDVLERQQTANGHHPQELVYQPQCRERPYMESMQGIERGTIGYIAALELGVADALREPESPFNDSLTKHRKLLLSGKHGLRHLTESKLVERLMNAGIAYHDDREFYRKPAVDFYKDLFKNLLFPPATRVMDSNDPYSLQVQINVLIEILANPVWIDFSIVEWRVRLGEVLWGPPVDASTDDHIFIGHGIAQQIGNQKFWLLFQILLSCELLSRLDAISMNVKMSRQEGNQSDIEHISECATESVRWSLVLARLWLENIELQVVSLDTVSTQRPSPGWLATLSRLPKNEITLDIFAYVQIKGRNEDQQLSSLLHFAKELRWPNVEALAARIAKNEIAIFDNLDRCSEAGTDISASTQHTNTYFMRYATRTRRGLSKCRRATAVFQPGWFSNSYISGLMLPGEGLSHFIICALLDNDKTAVSKLGPEASLYSGFCYSGRSYWSSFCVVGRVLAGGKGASECAGWISSDIVPAGFGDAWVDIDVAPIPLLEKYRVKPRIWRTSVIEHDGSVTRGADLSSVLPSDLILPSSDESTQRALHIKLQSLSLILTGPANTPPLTTPPTTSINSSQVPTIRTYSAAINYVLQAEGKDSLQIRMPLRYDAYFTTAHPCIVSDRTQLLINLTKVPSQITGQSRSGSAKTGHFLHKNFGGYTVVSLFDLLVSSSNSAPDSVRSPFDDPFNADNSTAETTTETRPKVLVVDCTDASMTAFPIRPAPSPKMLQANRHEFGSDMEIMARSICAYRGWNALISRRGMGCLACAIREATVLGWSVVLMLA